MGLRILKTNDEKTNLINLNPNMEHRNQDKTQQAKNNNIKCVNKNVNTRGT